MDWRIAAGSADPNPFASLDKLYQGILETSPDPVLAATWIEARSIMGNIEGEFYRGICETFPREAVFIFRRLSSLIGLVNSEGNLDLELYHKSLFDFLNGTQRSVALYVSPERARQFTWDRFYQVLRGMSKFSCTLAPLLYDPEVIDHTIRRRSQGEIGDSLPFLRDVCKHLYNYLDPHRTYGASDVDWWISHITFQEEPVE
ncbi:hypothetical protein FA13DRAFT_306838 [Coprinellus micaceus]|uniref:Uncharacterized protein n=1 Tax=Coprinellus micaceus TaxID=71717 RepID=A0A4Y7SDY8_COPMI|nr:hypothetical protein FA13DRAFT_306838 [Coprinellus micaceus]